MNLTLTPERRAQIKVWILMPTRSLSCLCPFHMNLFGMLREAGIWYTFRAVPGDSLVTRARNNLADIFLNESTDDNDHFSLWLDDDIVFDPSVVLQMLAVDKDFVAAPYTKKGLHMDRVAAAAQLGWKSADIASVGGTPNVNFLINNLRLDEPVPVLEAGSGFWLVKRKVFRMMAEALPIRYKRANEEKAHFGRDYAHDFFKVGIWPDNGEYVSEDWWFCREWRNLGGTVWCCFWIKSQHIGPYMYPMDMDAILGLLNTTGGYIHGETWPKKEKRDGEQGKSDVGGAKGSAAGEGESRMGPAEVRSIPTQVDGRSSGSGSGPAPATRVINAGVFHHYPKQPSAEEHKRDDSADFLLGGIFPTT